MLAAHLETRPASLDLLSDADHLMGTPGARPTRIRVDNGTERTSKALDRLDFTRSRQDPSQGAALAQGVTSWVDQLGGADHRHGLT